MRNSKEIRKWMIDAEISVVDIARELKVSHTLVSLTLTSDKNRKNNRMVLKYVLDKGCPAHILGLPKTIQRAA